MRIKHTQKFVLIVALLTVALVGCAAVEAAPPAASQAVVAETGTQASRTITVVGAGEVNLAPDIAHISIGAEARSSTVSEAKAETDRQIAAILSTLKELGIDDKDIQTSSYSIYYERQPVTFAAEKGAPAEEQGGYRVSSTLGVTIRDIDRVGEVLDAVVSAGANQVYGVSFTIADETKWQAKARADAVADARARATELAGLSGVELGQVLSISEVVGITSGPVSLKMAERAGGGIAPGELELSTQIQVTFAIQ
jgi:uncharacterized protein